MELGKAVRTALRDAKTFRPEIISRFDQIYVFRPPSEEVKCDIAGLKIAAAAKEYGVEVAFIDPELVADIIEQSAAAGPSCSSMASPITRCEKPFLSRIRSM